MQSSVMIHHRIQLGRNRVFSASAASPRCSCFGFSMRHGGLPHLMNHQLEGLFLSGDMVRETSRLRPTLCRQIVKNGSHQGGSEPTGPDFSGAAEALSGSHFSGRRLDGTRGARMSTAACVLSGVWRFYCRVT